MRDPRVRILRYAPGGAAKYRSRALKEDQKRDCMKEEYPAGGSM
jgi:hypothetical protein